jgi:hypothetical protein
MKEAETSFGFYRRLTQMGKDGRRLTRMPEEELGSEDCSRFPRISETEF